MPSVHASSTKDSQAQHRYSWIITLIISLLIIFGGFFAYFCFFSPDSQTGRITISPEFTVNSQIIPTTTAEISQKISAEKSFVVFVSQEGCTTADRLRGILQDFIANYSLEIFEINFSELKSTDLAPGLQFYPSVLIYDRGKLAHFLSADSDADAPAYKTLDGFREWFTQYVKV